MRPGSLLLKALSFLPPVRKLQQTVRELVVERDALVADRRRLELESKLWAEPGHYYSPLVDPEDRFARRAVAEVESDGPGPDLASPVLDERGMLAMLDRLAQHYPHLCFPVDQTPGHRFYLNNPAFSYGDAIVLFGFLLELWPKRIIEIGSGFSSCAIMDANDRIFGRSINVTLIDPYAGVSQLLPADDSYLERIRRIPVQEAPTEWFQALEGNDILFIDSSHVVKTGSDVLDCFFRILPALRPGVTVHLHDVWHPFEYPEEWLLAEHRSWNEVYLLRAFLQYNEAFRVVFFNDYVQRRHRRLLAERMPLFMKNTGASLWMRKVS